MMVIPEVMVVLKVQIFIQIIPDSIYFFSRNIRYLFVLFFLFFRVFFFFCNLERKKNLSSKQYFDRHIFFSLSTETKIRYQMISKNRLCLKSIIIHVFLPFFDRNARSTMYDDNNR